MLRKLIAHGASFGQSSMMFSFSFTFSSLMDKLEKTSHLKREKSFFSFFCCFCVFYFYFWIIGKDRVTSLAVDVSVTTFLLIFFMR